VKKHWVKWSIGGAFCCIAKLFLAHTVIETNFNSAIENRTIGLFQVVIDKVTTFQFSTAESIAGEFSIIQLHQPPWWIKPNDIEYVETKRDRFVFIKKRRTFLHKCGLVYSFNGTPPNKSLFAQYTKRTPFFKVYFEPINKNWSYGCAIQDAS
jgi:hypothetical protein